MPVSANTISAAMIPNPTKTAVRRGSWPSCGDTDVSWVSSVKAATEAEVIVTTCVLGDIPPVGEGSAVASGDEAGEAEWGEGGAVWVSEARVVTPVVGKAEGGAGVEVSAGEAVGLVGLGRTVPWPWVGRAVAVGPERALTTSTSPEREAAEIRVPSRDAS